MGFTLILAEKPSVARDLAKVLNCGQNANGYIMGKKYIVTWALGHLVTLADPEAYGNKYKTWNLEDLPMLPNKMELVVIKQTAKQYGVVRGLLNRADVDELVIATDSGREGELVARWIIMKAGFKKPIKRLWISSQTDKAIKEGFAKLRPSKEYDNLYYSAQSRAEADWLIGLNVTRALTCKYNAQLSAGRVQTPTLAMIVEREEEIRKFRPKDYWTISAQFNGFTVQWQDSRNNQTRTFNKEEADGIVAKITGQMGEVVEVKKETKKELPPLAYDLTELQRDANKKFSYSAKQTLNIMQRLYESHKLVTYPRTDSRYITDDIVPTLNERLKSIAVGPYAKLVQGVMRNKPSVTKRFVDNSKVTDHHAIIPTEQFVDLFSLNSEERNIYDLIVKRFIAVLSKPFEYEQTTVKLDIAGESFYAKGKIVKSSGWKTVYDGFGKLDEDDEDDNDQSLPDIQKGHKAKVVGPKSINGKTKPPARYTEATLLSAMEHPGKFVDNKALKEALESTSGLGTPATRADIIEKLFNTFYIERKGKEIYPTSKGTQLISLVPTDLKSPELTAKWEQQLTLISKGKVNSNVFVNDMKKYARKLVGAVIASSEQFKHDNVTREKCPECGKYLLEVNGKKGKMHICPDRECGYRKSVTVISNARCPECHKKMEIRGEGENKSFYCSCGYREKLDAFKKRKGQQVDKREVAKFMRQQEKDENINSALADALAKWKNN
ncbi:DNA topoisomerase III [Ruminiclostridium cellulolyticum]|uniref:DNA topoisomerase 3 n=1 Tax=Ruminiclostridium cellulolyticum (strain ATCC 35319 / DSM 5812 / JCM 6584 / H10) TaxID=394503 RepID=B8I8Q6_RUMCH|nr:DNA topoisomerase III [Ruminiclostridium cellulolyticum]ACL75289.1 DNA topoisomerase III [Ruminiclostridium cellulolyticum H10]